MREHYFRLKRFLHIFSIFKFRLISFNEIIKQQTPHNDSRLYEINRDVLVFAKSLASLLSLFYDNLFVL